MKYQDYSELFDTESATLACLSTFNFDPDFFERRLLKTADLDHVRRIVVFMDAQQWQLLRVQDASARWLNRRYLVVPVTRMWKKQHIYLVTNICPSWTAANLFRPRFRHFAFENNRQYSEAPKRPKTPFWLPSLFHP